MQGRPASVSRIEAFGAVGAGLYPFLPPGNCSFLEQHVAPIASGEPMLNSLPTSRQIVRSSSAMRSVKSREHLGERGAVDLDPPSSLHRRDHRARAGASIVS